MAASHQGSLDAFSVGIGVAAVLVIVGGVTGAVGNRNPRRAVQAARCWAGQLAGAPLDAAGVRAPTPA